MQSLSGCLEIFRLYENLFTDLQLKLFTGEASFQLSDN